MAVHTYRFRLQTPGVAVAQLDTEVGLSVVVSDHAGGVIVDVDCDDSRASDLIDSMASRGYEFVGGDPPSSAVDQFILDSVKLLGDYDYSAALQSTSSTTAQDAGISVTAPYAGNYRALFMSEIYGSNPNGVVALSLSTENAVVEKAGTVVRCKGLDLNTLVTADEYIGVNQGDVITGLYRMFSGPGSASVEARQILLQRIG